MCGRVASSRSTSGGNSTPTRGGANGDAEAETKADSGGETSSGVVEMPGERWGGGEEDEPVDEELYVVVVEVYRVGCTEEEEIELEAEAAWLSNFEDGGVG